jgi:hypothetical protein
VQFSGKIGQLAAESMVKSLENENILRKIDEK